MDIIKDITEIGGWLLKAPAWLLLVLALNLLGVFLQATPVLPDRFNKFIGLLLAALGMMLTPLIVPASIFPPEQPNPKVLLVIIGFIFGIAAWFLHGLIFQRVVKKFKAPGDAVNPNQQP